MAALTARTGLASGIVGGPLCWMPVSPVFLTRQELCRARLTTRG
jgi:hypothetical protein